MMIKKPSDWILKVSTGIVTLGCLIIFLVFSILVLPNQASMAEVYSDDIGSPDTSFFYTADELYRIAQAYGPEGRSAYIRARFTFDVAWPLVYLVFLGTSISWLLKRSDLQGTSWQLLNLVPLAGTIFDFLENVSTAIVMARFPQSTAVIDHLAGVFTLLKWVSISASFVVLVCSAVYFIWRWIQRKKSRGAG